MKLKKYKGFTLVELTIVLAIMVVIGSIVLPNFTNTTERARVVSDIHSAQIINNAINLFENETGQTVAGTTPAAVIENLRASGYLKGNITTTPQSRDGAWIYNSNTNAEIRIQLSEAPVEIYNRLTPQEQAWIATAPTATATTS